MASSIPFDGTNFLTGAPDQDQPHGNDYQEHQSTRKSLEFINNKEHDSIANDPSAADGGGEHTAGSAKIYHGDYSVAAAGDNLPSLRPDGVTALDASDAGRRAFDTDATFGGVYYRWSGSAWVSDGDATLNTDTDLSGNAYFLDEDDMSSNDDTKVASQQSIRAFVENILAASGAAKAYGNFNGSDGVLRGNSLNITSVNRNSAGNYTVIWDTNFSVTNYTVIATPGQTNRNVEVSTKTNGQTVILTTSNIASTPSDCDIEIAAFGPQ